MASGSNDWLRNAFIDEVMIYQKPGKPLPRPKGTALVEYDQDHFNQIDSSICKNTLKGARGQSDCEVYGRIVNKYVDGNLACKWGKTEATEATKKTTSQISDIGKQIEQQGAGSLFGLIGTGLKGVSDIIGTSMPPCNAHVLALDETIDSLYAPVPPQQSTATSQAMQAQGSPLTNAKKRFIEIESRAMSLSGQRQSNIVSTRRMLSTRFAR